MSWRRKGLQLPAKLWRWWIILRTIATIYRYWRHDFSSWYLFLQFSTHATAIWLLFPKVLPTRRYTRPFIIECTKHGCKLLFAHIDLGNSYRKNTTPPCDFLLETRTEILFFLSIHGLQLISIFCDQMIFGDLHYITYWTFNDSIMSFTPSY